MKDKKENVKTPQPMKKAMELMNLSHRSTDPQGSYTGQPLDRGERPVQDVDDL